MSPIEENLHAASPLLRASNLGYRRVEGQIIAIVRDAHQAIHKDLYNLCEDYHEYCIHIYIILRVIILKKCYFILVTYVFFV